jgi:hypothetical protein
MDNLFFQIWRMGDGDLRWLILKKLKPTEPNDVKWFKWYKETVPFIQFHELAEDYMEYNTMLDYCNKSPKDINKINFSESNQYILKTVYSNPYDSIKKNNIMKTIRTYLYGTKKFLKINNKLKIKYEYTLLDHELVGTVFERNRYEHDYTLFEIPLNSRIQPYKKKYKYSSSYPHRPDCWGVDIYQTDPEDKNRDSPSPPFRLLINCNCRNSLHKSFTEYDSHYDSYLDHESESESNSTIRSRTITNTSSESEDNLNELNNTTDSSSSSSSLDD